ncbi:hypothetical protein D3C85_1052670 [compost metagenome]
MGSSVGSLYTLCPLQSNILLIFSSVIPRQELMVLRISGAFRSSFLNSCSFFRSHIVPSLMPKSSSRLLNLRWLMDRYGPSGGFFLLGGFLICMRSSELRSCLMESGVSEDLG